MTTSEHPAAQPLVHECDCLAANPFDPDRVAPAVPRAQVDIPKAIAACRRAVAEQPDVPRFSYQLARVLFYGGDIAAAWQSFQASAAAGYRQARFMLGLLRTRGYMEIPQDDGAVAEAWLAAARQDHVNAQVSYVRDMVRGRFKTCAAQADKQEMLAFLANAEGKVDYLGGLLVADLKAAVEKM